MTLALPAGAVTARPAAEPGPTRRPLLLVVTGFLLLQLAWLITTPPYGGIDEFDHAYRAAAVAHGEWVAPASAATRGTGAIVAAPRDVVEAAGPQCSARRYTTDADCQPGEDLGDGLVAVPSGAGRYNPAFYAVAGFAALPFDGYAALYAMRAATIMLCAVLFAAATWSLLRWSRGPVPLLGLLLATTPVFVYSTSIVAPNGVEMTAGLATWTGLWGLLTQGRHRGGHLAVAVAGACVLATVRSLGPLWLALILLAVVAGAGTRAQVRSLLRWRPAQLGAVAVAVTTAASCVWILSMRSLVIGKDGPAVAPSWGEKLGAATESLFVWVLQSVAAFPTRAEPAPVAVYACAVTAFVGLLLGAIRYGERRQTLVAGGVAVAGLLIPFLITVATVSSYGVAFQGRYALPLTVGVPLLAAVAVDRRRPRLRRPARVLVPALTLLAVAHVWSVAAVVQLQRSHSPLAGTTHWLTPETWLVTLVAGAGMAALSAAVWLRASSPHQGALT